MTAYYETWPTYEFQNFTDPEFSQLKLYQAMDKDGLNLPYLFSGIH